MKTIEIKDYYGKTQSVPVSDELYDEWKALEREEHRVESKELYHRSKLSLDDIDDYPVTKSNHGALDALLAQMEDDQRLYESILRLTPSQRRRVMMYMDSLSFTEVAKHETCGYQAVYHSIQGAFRNLRDMLSDSVAS